MNTSRSDECEEPFVVGGRTGPPEWLTRTFVGLALIVLVGLPAGIELRERLVPEERVDRSSYRFVPFETLASFHYDDPSADTRASLVESALPLASGHGHSRAELERIFAADHARERLPVTREIPEAIRALHGTKAAIAGFMVPQVVDGGVREFLLVKNHLTCYQGPMRPAVNDWVYVEMAGEQTSRLFPVTGVTVYGTLRVGEHQRSGEVLYLYRLRADAVVPAEAPPEPSS